MSSTRYNLNFSEISRPLVVELHNQGFGIRDILNAGVLAFYRLTSDEQKAAIAEANGLKIASASAPKKKIKLSELQKQKRQRRIGQVDRFKQ